MHSIRRHSLQVLQRQLSSRASSSSQASLVSLLTDVIQNSNKSLEEKDSLLQEYVFRNGGNDKDHEISMLNIKLESALEMQTILQGGIQTRDRMIEWLIKEAAIAELTLRHHFKTLNVRAVIHKYEEHFTLELPLKTISRTEKWKEYLSISSEKFKPFKDAGYELEQVIKAVEEIYELDPKETVSYRSVETFGIQTGKLLDKNQSKILKIIIENTSWKDVLIAGHLFII